jgi:hypothetical protein
MKIEDAIKQLKQRKDQGVKSIVLAYWEADMFNQKDNDKWEDVASTIEDQMDWSMAHDQMSQILDLND